MRLIGLCGRSGSGKSCFADIAKANGIKVIDCDAVYKEMVSKPSPCLSDIEKEFGSEVINDNALNRKKLAEIVFSDPEKLSLLNSVTHKHIKNEIGNILNSFDENDIVLLDAPTLFESGIDSVCEVIIGIVATDDACIARITARDNITEAQARARLVNQYSAEFIVENCDMIIYNDSDYSEYKQACERVVSSLKEERP